MAENFEDLKLELLEHDKKVKQEDELQRGFNTLENNQSLRSLCDRMQKIFPKQPSLQDINAMIYVYTNLNPSSITENDQNDWVKQIGSFAKAIPDNYEDHRRLQYTMASLKKANASPKETYSLGKKLVGKMAPDSPAREACVEMQYQNADNYFKYALEYVQDSKNFKSYMDQTKAFNGIASILYEVKPTIRKSRFEDFADKMGKHYMHSEWGQVNFAHDRGKISKRVFKSLPAASRTAISNNRRRTEFYAR
ncbi:MAG: hypothetical protein LBR70_06285 [Lactobacillaceae bacterium]|jgi:hypothetical protein|nr:hypothetical protein [Lactobacillaceae bacterium]